MFHQRTTIDQKCSSRSNNLSLNSNASFVMNGSTELHSDLSQRGVCSMAEIPSYVINSSNNPYIVHLDRMSAKQHNECFPDYFYNSAFGSLLSGPTQLDLREANTSISEPIQWIRDDSWNHPVSYQHERIQQPNCDAQIFPNNCQNASQKSLLPNLIEFLNDFIPYLSCLAQYQPFSCIDEQKKLFDVIEQFQQLQVTLCQQNTTCHQSMASVDYSTMSTVLYQIRSLIYHLMYQEQYARIRTIPIQKNRFNHFLQRLQILMGLHTEDQPNVPATPAAPFDCCIPWPFIEPAQNLCPINYPCTTMFPIENGPWKRKRKRRSTRSSTKHLDQYEVDGHIRSNDRSMRTPTALSKSSYSGEESVKENSPGLIKSGRISGTSLSSLLSKKSKSNGTATGGNNGQLSQHSRLVSTQGSPKPSSSIDSVEHSFTSRHGEEYQQNSGPPSWSDQTHGYQMSSNEDERSAGLTPKLVLRYESSTSDVSNQKNTPNSVIQEAHDNASPSLSKSPSPSVTSSITSVSGRQTPVDQNRTRKENDLIIVSPSMRSYDDGSPRSDFISSTPSSPFPIDETNSHLNFDRTSPTPSQREKESTESVPHLNVIEGPRSAEGIASPEMPFTPNSEVIQKNFDTSRNMEYNYSPKKNFYGQQSGSATSSSSDQSSSINSRQRSSRKDFLNPSNGLESKNLNQEQPFSKSEGYFRKFMSCIRRTMVNRVENKMK